MENYNILRKIGSGSFAKVYIAIHVPSGKQVALKIIQKKLIPTDKLRERLEREIDNMNTLKHDNIVEYYESFETDKEMYIAMEYLSGDLFDYIAERQGLDETKGRAMFAQIAAALQFCHKNNISHRDLKLENILLSNSGKPKLIDFGFSKTSHSTPIFATYCGSALYASPEMITGKPYKGPECDIWSLGVILFCMLTACMPFDDEDWGSFVTCINRADYPQPTNLSQNVRHLLSRMLDPCVHTRATITEVLNHPWLASIPRKSSLQLPVAKRRIGISHSQSIALEISKNIIVEVGLTQCHKPSSCHDSALVLHCDECEQTISHPINRCSHFKTRRRSICSSGYSSSSESIANSPVPDRMGIQTAKTINDNVSLNERQNYEDVELVFV